MSNFLPNRPIILHKFYLLYQPIFEVLMNDDKDVDTLFAPTRLMKLFTAVINSVFSKLECLSLSVTSTIVNPSGNPEGTLF
jgi:hypothetical protein